MSTTRIVGPRNLPVGTPERLFLLALAGLYFMALARLASGR